MNRRQLLKQVAKTAGISTAAAMLSRMGYCYAAEQPSKAFRYAVCTEAFCNWPLEKGVKFAAECGYQGIEVASSRLTDDIKTVSPTQRNTIRRHVEQEGLKIVALHSLLLGTKGLHLTDSDAEVRRATSAYLCDLASFSADLGANVMVLGSPEQRNLKPGVSRTDGMKYAADVLSAAVPVLKQTGVVVAIEPLGVSVTNFLTTVAEAVELMRMVDSPYCRLQLDCKAMCEESTPIPDLIRKHHAECVHLHANDPNLLGPGFGKLDFVPIVKTLQEVDYRGWISVEPNRFDPGPERLIRDSIQYLRRSTPPSV